jgi:hypothetical protein
MREYCDVCGGLGVQVEVRPWNSAERVCEQGHRWFTNPVPGTGHPLPRYVGQRREGEGRDGSE